MALAAGCMDFVGANGLVRLAGFEALAWSGRFGFRDCQHGQFTEALIAA
jgi:hypothetical protein